MPETNRYDKTDRVKRLGAIIAGPLKVAAYQVRDPETDEWSKKQIHMTYDNMVLGVMGEEAAKLFARFARDQLGDSMIELLGGLLLEARQYVSDAGGDEDPEAQRLSGELLRRIDAATAR